MGFRVTSDEVREIIEIDASITNITAFIIQANLMVTNTFRGDTTIDSATLKEIERNLAAHLICGIDPRAIEEGLDNDKVKYAGSFGKGLNSTPYGQGAILLDPTGKLAKIGSKRASLGMISYSDAES